MNAILYIYYTQSSSYALSVFCNNDLFAFLNYARFVECNLILRYEMNIQFLILELFPSPQFVSCMADKVMCIWLRGRRVFSFTSLDYYSYWLTSCQTLTSSRPLFGDIGCVCWPWMKGHGPCFPTDQYFVSWPLLTIANNQSIYTQLLCFSKERTWSYDYDCYINM